jgi:DNA-directed RNA polymerase subunit RPC12/RpoP
MLKKLFSEKYQCPNCKMNITKDMKLKLGHLPYIPCPHCKKKIGIPKGIFRTLLPFEIAFVVAVYMTPNVSELNKIIVILLLVILSFTLGHKIDTLTAKIISIDD